MFDEFFENSAPVFAVFVPEPGKDLFEGFFAYFDVDNGVFPDLVVFFFGHDPEEFVLEGVSVGTGEVLEVSDDFDAEGLEVGPVVAQESDGGLDETLEGLVTDNGLKFSNFE